MRSNFLILFFSFISTNLISQHQFGLTLNPGISKFYNSANVENENNRSVFRFSGNGGLFYRYYSNSIHFGSDLLFVQIQGKDIMKINFTDANGNIVDQQETEILRNISYIGIPVTIGFIKGKFKPEIGIQFMVPFRERGIDRGDINWNGNNYSWNTIYKDINILNYDFGIIIGSGFKLTEKFDLSFRYYYGFKNIFDGSPQLDWVWNNHQMTFGVKYNILKNKKDNLLPNP